MQSWTNWTETATTRFC